MDSRALLQHRWNNRLQSLLLVVSLGLLVGYLGWILGGPLLSLTSVLLACLTYLFSSQASLQLTLRLYRTTALTPHQVPELYQVLSELCRRADLKSTPRLYYMPSPSLNAFALGRRDNAAIVLSDGLLRQLNLEQMIGVLGHELAHIHHNDLKLMGFADTFSRMAAGFSLIGLALLLLNLPLIVLFGEFPVLLPILLLLLAPSICALLQLALSRTREFEADRFSAELVGSPRPLIHALMRMDRPPVSVFGRLLWPGRRQSEPSLIRTHPPTAERIRRLKVLASDSAAHYAAPSSAAYLQGIARQPPQPPKWWYWF